MSVVYVRTIGVLAPGLSGWPQAQMILSGKMPYQETALAPFPKQLLPPNEQRRATATMKMVLQVAAEALVQSHEHRNEQGNTQARNVYSVFASSAGDSAIIDRICNALTLLQRPVSPTHFHNSVHNAPAGYWSISTRCQQPYTAISAHDASFSAGLLEATVTALTEQTDVLLVVYDRPLPAPLSALRNFSTPFSVAMLLSPQAQACMAKLNLQIVPAHTLAEARPSSMRDPALERLRCGNPAARSLPLLATLACQTSETLMLPYLDDDLLRLQIQAIGNDLSHD